MIFAGCTEEKTTSEITGNPNAIGFNISTGKTSRAAVSLIGTLQDDPAGIGIYATKKTGASQATYIDNLAYKYTSGAPGSWGWASENIIWPTSTSDYPMNFYAYHPKTGTSLTTALTKEYTINNVMSAQKDLLAANKKGVTTRPVDSDVDLNFEHILSQIKFKVVVGDGMTVKVKSIKLKNIGSVRTFNYSSLAWSGSAATNIEYPYTTTLASITDTDGITSTAIDGTSGSLMLIPQNLSTRAWDESIANIGSQTYIEVVYRMHESEAPYEDHVGYTDAKDHPSYDGSNPTKDLADTPLFAKVGYSLPTNWEKGKTYTYTIYLGTPTASNGTLIDDTYIDNTGADTDLLVEGTPGDPITDTTDPIGFTVDVTGWTDALGIDIGKTN
jgi:hypothetical protein